MGTADPLGVYRCSKCNKSYTKADLETLKKTKRGYKCKCGGIVEEIKSLPSDGLSLTFTEPHGGVEKYYYQMLAELAQRGFKTEKVKDVYTASEASDLWAEMERRKQFQADQAMKYIASIGSMMKSLFQMIRELRLIDERLAHYKGRAKGESEDDIALKGIWIDKVEGGAQKPSSIYGMATQLGFTTLPDLFFNAFPKTRNDIKKVIGSMGKYGLNKKIREVLQRKLSEYMIWVENTEKELKTGRKFKLMYLRQHFHVIRMYLDWVKPYLKNVQNLNILSEGGSATARTKSELIRAAEAAVMDIELFGVREGKDYYKQCIRVVFHFVSQPRLEFRKEYQRGPIHVGYTNMEFYGYAMTDSDLDAYRKTKIDDDVEILKSVFSSIAALEKEILFYLKQADDEYKQEKPATVKKKAASFVERIFKKGKKEKIPTKYERTELLKQVSSKLYDKTAPVSPGGVVWNLYDKYKKYFGAMRW